MTIETIRSDRLSLAFFALADPTRRAILERLATGEATVSELVTPFPLSQPTISRHLKVLQHAGLIEQGRDAQRRPRRLSSSALDDVGGWIDAFRMQWIGRLDNLAAHLAAIEDRED